MAYQYDANGNTTQKTKAGVITDFLYDIRDQLGEVREGPNILGRYGYDYKGRRILKIGIDGRRQYTYDQFAVITEADPANATVSKYDYGLDQLVRLDNRNEGRSFFHLDILRSTVSLTDVAGGSRQSIFYDAWGNERERIGASANKFTFTGHELDEETGLIYAKARFYDPDIGRFLSEDPLLGDVANAPSLNRYAYAFSNPLAFVDLNGQQATRPGRIEGQLGEIANYTEEYLVRAGATTCTETSCSEDSRSAKNETTGVVEELKWGDSGFTEGTMQGIGEFFGPRQPPTPDWQKSWARNFTESFADHLAFTLSEPAIRIQYGILTDDAEQIATGVAEQIVAIGLGKGITFVGEKVAAAAIIKYPWLAKPVTEAFRDASKGLSGALQKQAQRVITKLEELALRTAPEVTAPGAGASSGLRVQSGIRGGSSGAGGGTAATAETAGVKPSQGSLPFRRAGDPTTGIFEVEGEEVLMITSARGGAMPSGVDVSGMSLSTDAQIALKHVEGRAAAIMRARNIRSATLKINYEGGPCRFCVGQSPTTGVQEILLPNQRLNVEFPLPNGNIGRGYYVGGRNGGFVLLESEF